MRGLFGVYKIVRLRSNLETAKTSDKPKPRNNPSSATWETEAHLALLIQAIFLR